MKFREIIHVAANTTLDNIQLRTNMHDATGFKLETVKGGGFRLTFTLPNHMQVKYDVPAIPVLLRAALISRFKSFPAVLRSGAPWRMAFDGESAALTLTERSPE